MWMQQSMEGGGPHQRYGNYGGQSGPQTRGDDDWKTRLVSNGQWLGEKVLGLATRSHNSIPDNQRAHNDGRANWMAEIRNNARPGVPSNFSSSGYNGGGYQNDFATERPTQYSDSTNSYRPSSYSDANSYSNSNSNAYSDKKPSSSKADNNKKDKGRKSRKSKQYTSSESEESESEDESESAESEDSQPKRRSTKVRAKPSKNTKAKAPKPEVLASEESEEEAPKSRKGKAKGGRSSKKPVESEDDASTESAPEEKTKQRTKPRKKTASNYTYSFDPAKIPTAPTDEEKSTKKGKKSAKASAKAPKAEPAPAVDLLGVESLTISSAPVAQSHFVPQQPVAAIDQLAGLSFVPMDSVVPSTQENHSNFHQQTQQGFHQGFPAQHQSFGQSFGQPNHLQPGAPVQNNAQVPQQHFPSQQQPQGFVVPGSNLIDLRLSSEVAAAKSATPSDTRSLDQLKASTPHTVPQPSMPLPQAPMAHAPHLQQPMMAMQPHPMMAPPMMMMQPHPAQMAMPVPHAQAGVAQPNMAYGYPSRQQQQQYMMPPAHPGFM